MKYLIFKNQIDHLNGKIWLLGGFLFLLTFYSCKETKCDDCNSIKGVITITDSMLNNTRSIDDIVKSTQLIKLSTEKGAFFSEVSKFLISNDTLIVVDRKMSRIILFDGNGTFLRSIQHLGNGPGEYANLSDVICHQGILSILDIAHRKIHRYTLKDQYLSSIDLDVKYAGYQFGSTDDTYMFYRQNDEFLTEKGFNLIAADKKLTEITGKASIIPFEVKGMSVGANNIIDTYEESIYAVLPFDTLIYRTNENGGIDPAYVLKYQIDYLAKNNPVWKSENKEEFYNELMMSGAIWHVANLLVNQNSLIFTYFKGAVPYVCIYSKLKNSTKIYRVPVMTSASLAIDFIGKSDQYFYCLVKPGQVDKVNQAFNEELKADDNAVLIKLSIDDEKF